MTRRGRSTCEARYNLRKRSTLIATRIETLIARLTRLHAEEASLEKAAMYLKYATTLSALDPAKPDSVLDCMRDVFDNVLAEGERVVFACTTTYGQPDLQPGDIVGIDLDTDIVTIIADDNCLNDVEASLVAKAP